MTNKRDLEFPLTNTWQGHRFFFSFFFFPGKLNRLFLNLLVLTCMFYCTLSNVAYFINQLMIRVSDTYITLSTERRVSFQKELWCRVGEIIKHKTLGFIN